MQWRGALHGGIIDNIGPSVLWESTIWLTSSLRRRRSRLINIQDVYDHADAEFMYCG